jgi:hypothetical protein
MTQLEILRGGSRLTSLHVHSVMIGRSGSLSVNKQVSDDAGRIKARRLASANDPAIELQSWWSPSWLIPPRSLSVGSRRAPDRSHDQDDPRPLGRGTPTGGQAGREPRVDSQGAIADPRGLEEESKYRPNAHLIRLPGRGSWANASSGLKHLLSAVFIG